jgi:hypothetical protein
VKVVVVLHKQRFDVLNPALSAPAIETMNQEAERLLFIIDDTVFVLVILQFLICQIRETVCIFTPNALPLLRQKNLFLCNYLFRSDGRLWLYLNIGDITRIGGTL